MKNETNTHKTVNKNDIVDTNNIPIYSSFTLHPGGLHKTVSK